MAGAIAAPLVAVGGGPAGPVAYPQDPFSSASIECSDLTPDFSIRNDGYPFFTNAVPFTAQEKIWVAEGGFEWQSVNRRGGEMLVDVTQVPEGTFSNYPVYLLDDSSSTAGKSSCFGLTFIWLNKNFRGENEKLFRHTFSHEMGHIIGLHHTGVTDSYTPAQPIWDLPRMVTCVPMENRRASSGLGLDDRASLTWRHDRYLGQTFQRNLNPNFGFENNYYNWITVGGAYYTYSNGAQLGPDYGARRLNYFASSISDSQYLQSIVGVNTGDDTESYFAQAWLSKDNTAYAPVYLDLYMREKSYPAGDNGCSYPDQLASNNPNGTPAHGAWFVAGAYVGEISGGFGAWEPKTTGTFAAPQRNGWTIAGRLRTVNFHDGQWKRVAVDNFSVRGT